LLFEARSIFHLFALTGIYLLAQFEQSY
jgi:hypothetical protein